MSSASAAEILENVNIKEESLDCDSDHEEVCASDCCSKSSPPSAGIFLTATEVAPEVKREQQDDQEFKEDLSKPSLKTQRSVDCLDLRLGLAAKCEVKEKLCGQEREELLGEERLLEIVRSTLRRDCEDTPTFENLKSLHSNDKNIENARDWNGEASEIVGDAEMNQSDGPVDSGDYNELGDSGVAWFSCDICQLLFKEKEKLTDHEQLHNAKNTGKCESPRELAISYEFSTGKKNTYKEKMHHKCKQCHLQFGKKSLLQQHAKAHTNERPYSCDICEKSFKHAFDLKRHTNIHDATFIEEKRFGCVYCGRMFSRRSNLKRHVKQMHANENSLEEADQMFNEKMLTADCTDFNEDVEMEQPELSNAQTKVMPTLTIVDVSSQTLFACKFCEKKVKSARSLRRHLLLHRDGKQFKCDLCESAFKTLLYLNQHKKIHYRDTLFECSVCGKQFLEKSSLRLHLRIHTGQKPFNCELCGKLFRQSGHLRSHRKVHTKEKPFHCKYCNIWFTEKSSRTRHLKKFHNLLQDNCDANIV